MKLMLSRERTFEVAKYAGGCAFSIVIKILVTALLTALAAPVWLGYFCAQLVVLVTGYIYHSRVTFRPELNGWKERAVNFLHFTASVLAFKIADYLLVVIGVGYISRRLEEGDLLTPWVRQGLVAGLILATSGIIFFIRYFCYRTVFRSRAEKAKCS